MSSTAGSKGPMDPDQAEKRPRKLSKLGRAWEKQKLAKSPNRSGAIRCAAICCNSVKVPGQRKLFFPLPLNETLRLHWLRAIAGNVLTNRNKSWRGKRVLTYVCEDHFNLEYDLENYVRYRYYPYKFSRIRLKKNAVPSKFPMCHVRPNLPDHDHILLPKRPKMSEPSELATILQLSKNLAAEKRIPKTDRDNTVASNVAVGASKSSPSLKEGQVKSSELNAEEPSSRKVIDLLNGDISGLIARVQPSICCWDVSVVNVNRQRKCHGGCATSHETPQSSGGTQESARGGTKDEEGGQSESDKDDTKGEEGGELESAKDGTKDEEGAVAAEVSRSKQIETEVESPADAVADDAEPPKPKLDMLDEPAKPKLDTVDEPPKPKLDTEATVSPAKLLRTTEQEDEEWIPESDEASSLARSLPDSGSDSEEYIPKKKRRSRPRPVVRQSPRPSRHSARLAKRKFRDSESNDSESSASVDAQPRKRTRGNALRDTRSKNGDSLTLLAEIEGSQSCVVANPKEFTGRPKRNCTTKTIVKAEPSLSTTDKSDPAETDAESDPEKNKTELHQPAADRSSEDETETADQTADKVTSMNRDENVGVNPKWRSKSQSGEDCTLGVNMDETVATMELENAPTVYSFKQLYEKADSGFERADKFFIVKEKSAEPPEDMESIVLPQNILDLIDSMKLKMEKFFSQVDKLKTRVDESGSQSSEKIRSSIDELRSGMMSFPALFELEMSEFAHKCKKYYGSQCEEKDEELKSGRWCSSCKKKAHFHCCFKAAYCSVSCQLDHWRKVHKFYCQQVAMTLVDPQLRLNPLVAARVKTLNSRRLTVVELEEYYKSLDLAAKQTKVKSPCFKAASRLPPSVSSPTKKMFLSRARSYGKTKESVPQPPKSSTTSPKASGSNRANLPKRSENPSTIVASQAASDSYAVEVKTESFDGETQKKQMKVELVKNSNPVVEDSKTPSAVIKDRSKFAFAFKSPQVKVAIPPHLLPKVGPKPVVCTISPPKTVVTPGKPAVLHKQQVTTLNKAAAAKPLTTTIRCRALVLPNGKKQYIPVDGQSWPFKTPQGVLTMEPGAQNSFVKSGTSGGSIFITRPARSLPGFIQLGQGSSRSLSIRNSTFTVRPEVTPSAISPPPPPPPSSPPLHMSARLPSLTPCKPTEPEKVRTLDSNELDNILNTDHLKKVFNDSYFAKVLPSRP